MQVQLVTQTLDICYVPFTVIITSDGFKSLFTDVRFRVKSQVFHVIRLCGTTHLLLVISDTDHEGFSTYWHGSKFSKNRNL